MESLAIALYSLSGLVAAPVFCFCVARYAGRFPRFSRALRIASAGLLALFTTELISVALVGAVQVRAAVGPIYFPLHSVLTLLAAPALAWVSVTGRRNLSRWWPLVALVAWCVGVFAIFYQYDVGESLYGIDGEGGPYSSVVISVGMHSC